MFALSRLKETLISKSLKIFHEDVFEIQHRFSV